SKGLASPCCRIAASVSCLLSICWDFVLSVQSGTARPATVPYHFRDASRRRFAPGVFGWQRLPSGVYQRVVCLRNTCAISLSLLRKFETEGQSDLGESFAPDIAFS